MRLLPFNHSILAYIAPVIGGICGGAIEQYLGWHWNFWIQFGFGCLVQLIHLCCVPETRSTIMLNVEAKKRRKTGANVEGPTEHQKIDTREVLAIMGRPYSEWNVVTNIYYKY